MLTGDTQSIDNKYCDKDDYLALITYTTVIEFQIYCYSNNKLGYYNIILNSRFIFYSKHVFTFFLT